LQGACASESLDNLLGVSAGTRKGGTLSNFECCSKTNIIQRSLFFFFLFEEKAENVHDKEGILGGNGHAEQLREEKKKKKTKDTFVPGNSV
jgi:hypothetical protein